MKVYELLAFLKSKKLSLSDSYDLISYLLKIPYNDVKSLPDSTIIDDELLPKITKLLKKSAPVAYITHRREFYGREFYIDDRVLIPRVETEILVNTAKEIATNHNFTNVADLFTGSGVILLTLLQEVPKLRGVGVDISEDALEVANINRKMFGLDSRAELLDKDLSHVENISYLYDRFELIVANPPYIDEADYEQLEAEVKHEPKVALVSKDCGLFYYNMLLCQSAFAKGKLRYLIMEIGHNQRLALSRIADSLGIKYSFVKDYNRNDRVMIVAID